MADSIALANGIIEYEKFLGKDNSYLFKVEGDYYKDALDLANDIYESGLANFSMNGFLIQIEPRYMPNDPLYPYQWNLNNTGQGGGTSGADMGMAEAWEYALTPIAENNGGVFEIAYLDDGIADHEDLGLRPAMQSPISDYMSDNSWSRLGRLPRSPNNICR